MNQGSPQKRKRKWPLLVVGLFLLICLTPLLIVLFWRISLSADIERLEQRARERGEFFTAVEIEDAQLTPPDESNAFAPLIALWTNESAGFRSAHGARSTPGASGTERTHDSKLPILGREAGEGANQLPWTADQLERVRSFARTNQARAAIVSDALGRANAAFFVRYSEGMDAKLPHLAPIKVEAGELRLLSMLAIAEGRAGDAIQRIHEAVRLGNLLDDDHALISHLVQIACWSLTIESIQELLSFETLNEGQLRSLEEAVRSINPREALRVSMIGERAMLGTTIDRLPQHAMQGVGFENMTGGLLRATGFMELDRRYALRLYEHALVDLFHPDRVDYGALADRFAGVEQEMEAFPPKLLSSMLLPAWEKTALKFGDLEARRRAVLTALAIERYRLQHDGRLPAALDELTNGDAESFAIDPYTGEPLKYVPSESGYLLYSLGRDETDQGGVARKRYAEEAYDVPFKVEWQDVATE